MRRSLKALAACTVGLLVMAFPAAASAASRYVTPTGSAAAACTSIDPCTLAHAIELAESGDDISLSSGIYGLSASVLISTPNIDVHGAGLELTRLKFSSDTGLSLTGTGSQVRDLRVDTTGSGFGYTLIVQDGVTVQRVLSHNINGAGASTRVPPRSGHVA